MRAGLFVWMNIFEEVEKMLPISVPAVEVSDTTAVE